MKKVIFGLAVVAVAALSVYNANKSNATAQMNDLQLENIEALAQQGEPKPVIIVGTPCRGNLPKDACFLGASKYSPDFMVVDGIKYED